MSRTTLGQSRAGTLRPTRRVFGAPSSSPASPSSLPAPAFHPQSQTAFAAAKAQAEQGRVGRTQGLLSPKPTSTATGPFIATTPSLQTVTNFAGITLNGQIAALGPDQAIEPPDTQVAAGPNNVVELVNSSMSVYDKTGNRLSIEDLNSFFPVPSGYRFTDPRVLYDAPTGRWMASGLSFDSSFDSQTYVAVSVTSNPAGNWNIYTFAANTNGTLYDQPKLGVNDDKVVLSWNDFESNGTFLGSETYVVQKSDMLSGSTAQFVTFGPPDTSRFGLVPTQSLSSTSTEYIVYLKSSTSLGVIAVTGTPSQNNVAELEVDLAISAVSVPPNAQQPGTSTPISTNDDRLLSAVWRNGNLSASGNDACTPAGDTTTRSCLRLLVVNTAGSTVTLDGDLAVPGTYLYFPSVMWDSGGNLYVVATESSTGIYPSVITIASSTGASFVSVELGGGNGPYSGTRWGDYSGAGVDPSDAADVWVAGELTASSTDSLDWGTQIGRLTFAGPGRFFSVTPYRVLDTRNGTGHSGALGPNSSFNLQVTGTGSGADSVPPGATAVVMNVTEADATAGSYLTVWPTGRPRPTASNLNFTPGQVVPNLVEAGLSSSGKVSFYNDSGNTNVVADVEGYVDTATSDSSTAGLFDSLSPTRILDTRNGTGHSGKIGPSSSFNLQVTGRGGVPSSGVSAVVLNVTVTDTTAPSFLTLWPTGAPRPLASNLNFSGGQTVPNRVMVRVGTGGQVSIYNAGGSANVIADVGGWFTDGSNSSATGDHFTPASAPVRILDTRSGLGHSGAIGANSHITLNATLSPSPVPSNADAVVANFTVTDTTAGSYLSVYPGNEISVPTISDLNWPPGATLANLVVTKLGNQSLNIYNNSGSTNAIADVEGWYSP